MTYPIKPSNVKYKENKKHDHILSSSQQLDDINKLDTEDLQNFEYEFVQFVSMRPEYLD